MITFYLKFICDRMKKFPLYNLPVRPSLRAAKPLAASEARQGRGNPIKKLIILFPLFLALSGCEVLDNIPIADRSCEYQKSSCLPPLSLPPAVAHSAQIGDDLTIPHLRRACAKTSLLPPDSLALQVEQGKLSKKALMKRDKECRLTQIVWSKNSCGAPVLITNEALTSLFFHMDRALKTLCKLYCIKSKNLECATFYIYDLVATNGKVMPTTPIYQVRLIECENGTMITLATDQPEAMPSVAATRYILTKIYEALDETKEGLSLKQWLFS